jgi:hypothetical protein
MRKKTKIKDSFVVECSSSYDLPEGCHLLRLFLHRKAKRQNKKNKNERPKKKLHQHA